MTCTFETRGFYSITSVKGRIPVALWTRIRFKNEAGYIVLPMKGKQKETCSNRKSIQRSVFSINIKGQSLMEKNNKGEKLTESSLSVVTWCELLMSEWYGLSGSKRSAVSFRYSLTESSQFGHPTYFHSLYLFTHFCHFLLIYKEERIIEKREEMVSGMSQMGLITSVLYLSESHWGVTIYSYW